MARGPVTSGQIVASGARGCAAEWGIRRGQGFPAWHDRGCRMTYEIVHTIGSTVYFVFFLLFL